MDMVESNQHHLYIKSIRDDIHDFQQQLQKQRQDIAAALDESESLTIDACTLRVRIKELEFDEELLKRSEEAAIVEKLRAEKKLMEVGGYERAVRMQQKALRDAKQELQNTKSKYNYRRIFYSIVVYFTHRGRSPCNSLDEKVYIMSEEKKLHQELVQLHATLHKSQSASVKLQQEYNAALKGKQETDVKLERLSLFLQKTIESTAAQGKESALSLPSPTSGSPTAATTADSSPAIAVDTSLTQEQEEARLTESDYAERREMDKYRRVEKPKTQDETPVQANEIRITQQGKVRSYISYANGLFAGSERGVVLKAMGNAISKAVTVAEILKHRVENLHQITQISSIETVDVYEPLEEGLDRIEQKRHIPSISIQLSLDELNKNDPGYQQPIPVELVSASGTFDEPRKPFKKAAKQKTTKKSKANMAAGEGDGEEDQENAKGRANAVETTPENEESSGKEEKPTRGDSKRGRGRGGRTGGRGAGRKPRDDSTAEDGNPEVAKPASSSTPEVDGTTKKSARIRKPRKNNDENAAPDTGASSKEDDAEAKKSGAAEDDDDAARENDPAAEVEDVAVDAVVDAVEVADAVKARRKLLPL
uniref:DNA/RNA-binding protein Alba-like domain-containing protein n=1 Tax=Globisporangium ultimum (strain ATCC 200006 / CBS 805.95 / DAOM BR144) TaxID=431595 RepID=K3WGH5_GLOUD